MEEGLSLGDIWRIIMRKKIPASIAFGIATILIFIIISFGYNKMVASYEIVFNYDWYGIENNAYANGNKFNYFDIINYNNLKKARASANEFAAIDIEDMSKNIEITISEKNYDLIIHGSYFKDDSQARRFMLALINIPYEIALNLDFDFTANLEGFRNSGRVMDKLNYLSAQMDLISNGYQGLIDYFGNFNVNNTNLEQLLERLQVFKTNNDLTTLRYMAYKNAYLTKEEYEIAYRDLATLQTEKEILNQRKTILLNSIASIYDTSNNNPYIDTALTKYLESLHTIDQRLIVIEENLDVIKRAMTGQYDSEKSEEYMANLNEYASKLDEFNDYYLEAVKAVLAQTTFVNVLNYKVLNKLNRSISVIISLVLGTLIGLGVGFIMGYIEEKREKEEKNY